MQHTRVVRVNDSAVEVGNSTGSTVISMDEFVGSVVEQVNRVAADESKRRSVESRVRSLELKVQHLMDQRQAREEISDCPF